MFELYSHTVLCVLRVCVLLSACVLCVSARCIRVCWSSALCLRAPGLVLRMHHLVCARHWHVAAQRARAHSRVRLF